MDVKENPEIGALELQNVEEIKMSDEKKVSPQMQAESNHQNVPMHTEKKKKKKHICKLPTKWYQIITQIGWLVMIGFCIWYIINSSGNYNDAQNNPVSSLSLTETLPLDFPAITICNFNVGDVDKVDVTETTILNSEYKEIEDTGALFYCYVFNNLTTNILKTNHTGYTGVVSLYFTIPLPTTPGDRIGLQVSFHEIGTTPRLMAETNYAIPNVDNFFTITKFNSIRLKPTPTNPNLKETWWESSYSNIEVVGDETTQVIVSIAYTTLNLNTITEVTTSSIPGLLGEIAGILGLTMGIDLLKLLRGFLDIPKSIKKRTLRNVYETFN